MPQPHSSDPPEVLAGAHNCPRCAFPMLLAVIEPANKNGREWRVFECPICNHFETVEVEFR